MTVFIVTTFKEVSDYIRAENNGQKVVPNKRIRKHLNTYPKVKEMYESVDASFIDIIENQQ